MNMYSICEQKLDSFSDEIVKDIQLLRAVDKDSTKESYQIILVYQDTNIVKLRITKSFQMQWF